MAGSSFPMSDTSTQSDLESCTFSHCLNCGYINIVKEHTRHQLGMRAPHPGLELSPNMLRDLTGRTQSNVYLVALLQYRNALKSKIVQSVQGKQIDASRSRKKPKAADRMTGNDIAALAKLNNCLNGFDFSSSLNYILPIQISKTDYLLLKAAIETIPDLHPSIRNMFDLISKDIFKSTRFYDHCAKLGIESLESLGGSQYAMANAFLQQQRRIIDQLAPESFVISVLGHINMLIHQLIMQIITKQPLPEDAYTPEEYLYIFLEFYKTSYRLISAQG